MSPGIKQSTGRRRSATLAWNPTGVDTCWNDQRLNSGLR